MSAKQHIKNVACIYIYWGFPDYVSSYPSFSTDDI